MYSTFSSFTQNKISVWLARHREGRTVAVFDWDNTVIQNDIGEAVFWHMLAENLFPWLQDWGATNTHLTEAAIRELSKESKKSLSGALDTSGNSRLARKMMDLYEGQLLPETKVPGWDFQYDPAIMYPPYAWIISLCAGLSLLELKEIARAVVKKTLSAPADATFKVGFEQRPGFTRVREPVARLIERLQSSGIEVWICSASAQSIVEAFAEKLDIPSSRVIGVRPSVDDKGLIVPGFQACAGFSDRNHSIICYRQGKRAWINKLIFNQPDGLEQLTRPAPINFGAGDSDGDEFLLRDARELKLVIHRKDRPLPKIATENRQGEWAIESVD